VAANVGTDVGSDVGADVSIGKGEWFMVLSHCFMYHGGFGLNGCDKQWGRHTSHSMAGILLFIGCYFLDIGRVLIWMRAV